MLSMKTGINTESMCIPSWVQGLTQDRKFNTETKLKKKKISFNFFFYINKMGFKKNKEDFRNHALKKVQEKYLAMTQEKLMVCVH